MAQFWHLPWGQSPPNLYRVRGRRAPAPMETLETRDRVPLGWSSYRGQKQPVVLKKADRRQHVYILGATRTGKTTALSNMISFDIRQRRGVTVIDPHGDLPTHLMRLVPAARIDDVIYFDPADTRHPMGFNLLDGARGRPSLVAGELMHLFHLLWGSAWGPRMNDILHNCFLVLLDLPGATLADVPLLLTCPSFRQRAVASVSNLAMREFWEARFNRWPPSQQMESAESILHAPIPLTQSLPHSSPLCRRMTLSGSQRARPENQGMLQKWATPSFPVQEEPHSGPKRGSF